MRGVPAAGPRDTPAYEDRGENTRALCRWCPPLRSFLQQHHRVSPTCLASHCCLQEWGLQQSGGPWGVPCSRCVRAGGGNTALLSRVWLYVDDQLQQMKPHRGPLPRPQPQPEGPPRLLLGGLPESDTIQNFSGCISNVFVQR